MTTNITTVEDRLVQLGIKRPAPILIPRGCPERPIVNGEDIRIDGGAHAGTKW